MAKSSTIRDLFVKICKVFPKDMYIIDYRYCIAGNISDDNVPYSGLCILDPEFISVVKNTFTNHDIIYIKDINLAKDKLDEAVEYIETKSQQIFIRKRLEALLVCENDEMTWDSCPFTEKDIIDMYEGNISIELFRDNSEIPNLTTGKSMFPLMTEKTIGSMLYSFIGYNKQYNIANIVFSYPFSCFFSVYLFFAFINLED